MEFIEWRDEMSVGVSKFDDEHKQLISFINKLNQALKIGSAKKSIEDTITGLVKYTVIHFRHEEDYMKIYEYPEYDSHKIEHDNLTSQVKDFHERFKSGDAPFSIELLNFLRDWLTNHIMSRDMKYKEFFRQKGA